MIIDRHRAETLVLEASGRSTLAEAVAWIGEGHRLTSGTDLSGLLQALLLVAGTSSEADNAVRRIVQEASASDFDTSALIFAPEWLPSPEAFRRALEVLARRAPGGTLATLTAESVLAAQREEAQTINVLSLIAGLSYRDLRERVPRVPTEPDGQWDRESVADAFATIDSIVRGELVTDIEGAIAARPVELLLPAGGDKGWSDVQRFYAAGVPYELMLAQRAVGTAWGAHRNRTSSRVRFATAEALGLELAQREIEYLRSTSVGGDVQPSAIEELTGTGRQLGLVALSRTHRPIIGVAFSTARDGGTARANIGGLLMAREASVPVALVLTGPGWATRGETVQLARAFDGRVFTDRSLSRLADDIASMAR